MRKRPGSPYASCRRKRHALAVLFEVDFFVITSSTHSSEKSHTTETECRSAAIGDRRRWTSQYIFLVRNMEGAVVVNKGLGIGQGGRGWSRLSSGAGGEVVEPMFDASGI